MKVFGLIGHPLGHSFSKQYFDDKFAKECLVDVFFELYDIESIDEIKNIIKNTSLKGLAITIPYKSQIIPFLETFDNVVAETNACNCIKVCDGKLIGYNTDVIGFENSLLPNLKSHHQKALVLGNGGAASAVKFVLRKLGIEFKIVTRTQQYNAITFEDLDRDILENHQLIINTTPVGTYPNINDCVNFPFQHISNQHFLFDLVYNPTVTAFMQKGLQRNATVKNGYEMLVVQAEENWNIWNQIN